MTEGKLLPNIIKFTVPIILTNQMQSLFSAADLVVVNRFGVSGSAAGGAVGANTTLITLMVNFFIGVSVGGGVAAARALGENNGEKVSKSVHTSMLLAVICGAFLTLFGIIGSRYFLTWMGTPKELLGLSVTYLRIYLTGVMASLIYNFGTAILRAAGDTKGPLLYITVAGVVNVILNLFFVVCLKLDVAGVALATAISNYLSAGLVVRALMKRRDACRLYLSNLKIHGKSLAYIVKIGIPSGIQSALFNISNVLIQSSVNSFGEAVVSGTAAGHNIEELFVKHTVVSFEHASLNFAARNAGAKKFDRVKKSVALSCLCAFAIGAVLGPLTYSLSPYILKFYIPDAPEKIVYGVVRMAYICRFYALLGIMDSIGFGVRGIGASTTSMIISLLGVCAFRVVWIYTFFARYHTLECLYLSYPVSWALTFAAQLVAFVIVFRRMKRKEALNA